MADIYDNWERLVRATLDREQLRQIALRTPSDLSTVSASSSFNFTSPSHSTSSFNLSSLLDEVTSTHRQILETKDYLSSSNLIEHGPSGGALIGAVAQPLVKDLAAAFQEQGQYAVQFPTQFKKLEEQLRYMQSFVAAASKFKDKRETVKKTLAEVQELIYEVDDLVIDCRIREDYRKMKGSSIFPLSLSEMSFRYEMGRKLTEINNQIRRMRTYLNSYYIPIAGYPDHEKNSGRSIRWRSSVFDQSEMVGLTEDAATIRSWILAHDEPVLRIAIVGLGGSGKTTLAVKIFRDVNVTRLFQKKIWVSVSQSVDEVQIIQSMLRQLGEDDRKSSKVEMLNLMNHLLSDKTYLFVLDDVWSIDDGWWENISSALPETQGTNNCIIITSRIREVVKKMGVVKERVFHPKLFLDDKESWALFCKVAQVSANGEASPIKLVEVGKNIVEKCLGHSLAIKIVGGLLSSVGKTTSEWTRICENFHDLLTTMELGYSEGIDPVLASLKLSYDELPAYLKQCLLCFSIYPEDYEIDVEQLIHWWVGEGFVRGTSRETAIESAFSCLSELLSRCLVEVSQRRNFDGRVYTCKVDDIIHDFTIKIAKEEDFCSFNENGKPIANTTSRRLGVTRETNFRALRRNSNLRALLLITTDYIGFNRNVELAKVKSLRVLDLSHVKLDYVFMKDLWYWITSLKRLTYLNLGYVEKLIRVPNTIDKLWGLQILILRGCKNLEKLPLSILNLPRLTILDVGYCPKLRYLPLGLSRLSNLQELYGFKVAGPVNAAGSRLCELKALTELRVLYMDITEESTIQGNDLSVLEQLQKLSILSINAGDCEDKDILRNLDNLSPPPCIQELYLKNYIGETTPGWMNPKSLRLLQYLCVENSRVNKMNRDFWGDEDHKWGVKGLCLKFCPRLQASWEDLKAVMPEIRYLEASQCYSLESFPCDVKAAGFWYKNKNKKYGNREDAFSQKD